MCVNTYSEETVVQSDPRKIDSSLFTSKGFVHGPVVPGLKQGYVPQGMAYLPKRNSLCLSMYSDSDSPSILSFINLENNQLTKTQNLKVSKSRFLYGHVGEVAVNEDTICVSSDSRIYIYKHNDELELIPSKIIRTETSASFCTYYDNRLYVGEFVYGKKYKSKKTHYTIDRKGKKKYAIICGYEGTNPTSPVCAISIRQKVQGAAITHDYMFLSISYGRANRS